MGCGVSLFLGLGFSVGLEVGLVGGRGWLCFLGLGSRGELDLRNNVCALHRGLQWLPCLGLQWIRCQCVYSGNQLLAISHVPPPPAPRRADPFAAPPPPPHSHATGASR